MDSLNDKQRSAFEAVERGHNIFIGGNAGVGKSFLVTEIFKKLTAAGKKVAITCTTGIACAVYLQTLNPMTVHKWSMIGDGRFTGNQLHNLLMDDDRYSAAKSRIHENEILIIDETSMLSLKMFDMIEYVMRMIKNEKVPFGGTQIVLVGSFLQLPPVRNARYIDCGEFCFKSDYFPHHHIYLTRVIRQSDSELASIINILSIGNILDKYTEEYVQSLDRPLPSSAGTTRLFACNYLVDMYTRDTVLKIQGQLYSFKAIDEGEEKYLQRLVVQKILWMKVGATVMLLRNLSDDLVNGLRGSVVAIREGEVDVHFPTINKLTTLQRMSFTVFDPSRNTNLAVRLQIPLKLAYAMTIHKAQGLTLDRVEIDCRGIFQPGQLAVAVGRVKSVDGLRVVNFTKNAVIQQPKAVLEFQTCSTTPVEEDRSCCLHW